MDKDKKMPANKPTTDKDKKPMHASTPKRDTEKKSSPSKGGK